MTYLFYFPAFIAILWELMYGVLSPKRTHSFVKSFKGKKFDDLTSSQKSVSVCMIFYMIWVLVGLMSSQWVIFIALLLVSILIPKKILIIRWIDSLISLALLIFLILNKFHLHIDLWKLIKEKFINQ